LHARYLILVGAGPIALLYLFSKTFSPLLSYLFTLNLVTFLLYLYDKYAARHTHYRIPEKQLHLFELLGGSPAALAAQRILRHKSSKSTYQRTFWSIIMLQSIGILYLYLPPSL
jgi:uncharacterized membrane protein YsdA (DUF1294 family)